MSYVPTEHFRLAVWGIRGVGDVTRVQQKWVSDINDPAEPDVWRNLLEWQMPHGSPIDARDYDSSGMPV